MRTMPTPQEHDVLSGSELAQIKEICADAKFAGALNDWETEFIDSIRDRVKDYGDKARISEKQWEVLERIEAKLYG